MPKTPAVKLPPIRKRPSLDVSLTGLIYIVMTLFMALAAMNTQAALLFGVFGLMVGILLVSWLVSRHMLRHLEISRLMPDSAVVGRHSTITYTIRNKKRFWPTLSVTIHELGVEGAFAKPPYSYLLHVAPKTTAVVSGDVVPRRRGLYQLDRYQLSTSFPFGFVKRALVRRESDSMLVYPPIASVDARLLHIFRSADSQGHNLRPRSGGVDEFYGLREYRAGDNPRSIYWRRSARTGTLVRKEMTHVAPPRLLLVIDTFLTPSQTDPAHIAGIERAIAMAASLADVALEAGLGVGVVAYDGELLHVPVNRGKRHRADVLSKLAQLPINQNFRSELLLQQARSLATHVTTTVLIDSSEVSSTETRSGQFTLGSRGELGAAWFHFPPEIDFAHIGPADFAALTKPVATM